MGVPFLFPFQGSRLGNAQATDDSGNDGKRPRQVQASLCAVVGNEVEQHGDQCRS